MIFTADKHTCIDLFKCKLAGAAGIQSSLATVLVILWLLYKIRKPILICSSLQSQNCSGRLAGAAGKHIYFATVLAIPWLQ
ncbi:Uncharacterized protein OBRU01_05585 [Operophtera brumata]|uniref:Uncharacterized protein n=1 Tax=Operophtera brumata TaxID=104452 RepID=A0A0L7LLU2_OPEBR|nr:Uncharacterized protein OBRU01_05585 [Operophtera brumata]